MGSIPISGAKNACLTLMPAALLTDEPVTLTNAPRLSDIRTMTALLQSLGCEVASPAAGARAGDRRRGDRQPPRRLRHRAQDARLDPGARADAGPRRPRRRVAARRLRHRRAPGRPAPARASRRSAPASTSATATSTRPRPRGLKGAVVDFPFVSVGATENVLMAATLARGTTVIRNAAREPEIVDLAQCLRRMGAQIAGEGSDTIEVRGVDRLQRRHPPGRRRPDRARHLHAGAGDHRRRGRADRRPPRPGRRLRRQARGGGDRGHRDQRRPEGQPDERPGEGGRRRDRALPRLPDRPAGADDGAARPSPTGSAGSRSASSRTASCTPPS